jgi:hypothetical protein
MNRAITPGLAAVLSAAALCLPACETTPDTAIPVSSGTSRQTPAPLVAAPQELADSPEWVMVDPVRVDDSVRFHEYDPGMTQEALATLFRREMRDQVVDTQHFRVYGEFGEKSPQLARYIVRGTLRRLDVGPEFDADVRGGAVSKVTGDDVQIQTVRPVTCELRIELIATDKVDPRIGLPGETVAIGNAEVSFNVGSKFSIVTGTPGEGARARESAQAMEAVKVQREQVPGCLLRTVRLALNDLLTKANSDVFLKEARFIEEDRRAAEERKRQPDRASLPLKLDVLR